MSSSTSTTTTTSRAPPQHPDTSSTSSSSESETLIPSLPNDVSINILARVPRYHHPTLSLVSKPFLSILSSPLFITTRSLLKTTQYSLFLTLRSPSHQHHSFTLLPTPTTTSSSRQRRLIPIAQIPTPSIGSAYATLGHHLYVLGGSQHDVASPLVWVLDALSNKWAPGPNMRVAREFPAAGVVDGKLYVMGGCVADTWAKGLNWAEVYDPGKGTWEAVESPVEVREKWMHASAVIGRKVYAMADRGGVVYDVGRNVWECVEGELDMGWRGRGCVIGQVLYCYDYLGKIRGFDVDDGVWKELRGVKKGLPKFLCGATMVDFGGNLVVVWEKRGENGKEMEVWCAEIEVGKDGDGDLRGSICWVESVLSVPVGCTIVNCSAVAL